MVDTKTQTDVLDLRLAPREVVRIDGKTYDLMPIGDLSVPAQAKVQRHGERIAEIEAKGEDASPEDEAEYDDRMRALARIALPDAPARVVKSMSLGWVRVLVATFLDRGASRPEYVEMAAIAGRRSPISSPISPASTARANGS